MPGFDGTGPRGMGPMTGGGRGFCSPWGRGVGARGYGRRWPGSAYPYYGGGQFARGPQMTTGQELEDLRAQAQELAGHLESIHQRITDLEKRG